MFEVTLSVDGRTRTARPITLLGVHGAERQNAGDSLPALADLADLPAVARDAWQDDAPAADLIGHAVRDATGSSIIGNGVVGAPPSPLAPVRPDRFGAFRAGQATLEAFGRLPATFELGEPLTSSASPDVALHVDGKIIGALVFAVDALIVALPPVTGEVSVRYTPDPGFQQRELEEAMDRVTSRVGAPGESMLVWRAYEGANTLIIDGVAELARKGWHRIKLAALRPLVLVGRLVFAAHRRIPEPRGDFTARRRRRAYELAEKEVATSCPEIRTVLPPQPAAVVAVHGTMACGVPLAGRLRDLVTTEWPILRYEHDTWLPVEDNARELSECLSELRLEHIVLVAHSRGGLVARHAAELTTASNGAPAVRTVTLGTPFKGTPFVGPARTTLLGTRALLGMVRLASGVVAVDLATRLAGLLIRSQLPRGLAAMDEDSDYLSGFAHRPPTATTTIAGDFDFSDNRDANMIGFLEGMAPTAFEGEPNDLVVGTASAAGDCDETLTVTSDHFSYWDDERALTAVDQVLRGAAAEEDAAWLEATGASRGNDKAARLQPRLKPERDQNLPADKRGTLWW